MEWKPIPRTDGLYLASSEGGIKRRDGNSGRPLKAKNGTNGYKQVNVTINSSRKTQSVHVLVAEVHFGLCGKGLEVNHRDANKANNAIENLEYVTSSENKKHAYELGLYPQGEECNLAKLSEGDVRGILLMEGTATTREIAAKFSVDRRTVRRIYSGHIWKRVTGRKHTKGGKA